jgi:hypothetical protein
MEQRIFIESNVFSNIREERLAFCHRYFELSRQTFSIT